MLAPSELQAALSSVRLVAVHGPWSRAVMFRHLLTRRSRLRPLWGGAARSEGGRFTPRESFDSIYLAWNAVTAFAEVQALLLLASGRLQPLAAPWVVMTVNGIVSAVLDLSDARTREHLGTNEQEISGFWKAGGLTPTQMLGQAAFDCGRIVGIKYPSAKDRDGDNLVVFPDRLSLTPTDYLEVHDPRGHLAQRIGA